jgi:hypothetical protein
VPVIVKIIVEITILKHPRFSESPGRMLSDFDPLRHTISPPEQILLRKLAQVIQISSSRAGVDQAIDTSIRFLKQRSSHWTRHIVMK